MSKDSHQILARYYSLYTANIVCEILGACEENG